MLIGGGVAVALGLSILVKARYGVRLQWGDKRLELRPPKENMARLKRGRPEALPSKQS
jgi:hypothetical protein